MTSSVWSAGRACAWAGLGWRCGSGPGGRARSQLIPSNREGQMRCQWTVRRTMRPDPDGQRRWDRAYQEVLPWTRVQAVAPAGASRGPGAREDGHEGGALRPGIDAAASAGPDGRAADRTPDGP